MLSTYTYTLPTGLEPCFTSTLYSQPLTKDLAFNKQSVSLLIE